MLFPVLIALLGAVVEAPEASGEGPAVSEQAAEADGELEAHTPTAVDQTPAELEPIVENEASPEPESRAELTDEEMEELRTMRDAMPAHAPPGARVWPTQPAEQTRKQARGSIIVGLAITGFGTVFGLTGLVMYGMTGSADDPLPAMWAVSGATLVTGLTLVGVGVSIRNRGGRRPGQSALATGAGLSIYAAGPLILGAVTWCRDGCQNSTGWRGTGGSLMGIGGAALITGVTLIAAGAAKRKRARKRLAAHRAHRVDFTPTASGLRLRF